MKKYFITLILIISIIISSCLPVSASDDNFVPGESGKPAVLISSSSGKAGDIVEVELSILNNPGICAICINVNYSEGLELIEAEDCGLFDNYDFADDKKLNPFELSWETHDKVNNVNDGTIAKLTFKVPENPNAEEYKIWISYNPKKIYDKDMKEEYFEAGFAEITVDGFAGYNNQIESSNSEKNIKTEENTVNSVALVVSICCALLLIIIGVVVLVILKKKKR